MSETYPIHKIIIDKYLDQLSDQAFCVLFRFYRCYLKNSDEKTKILLYSTFQKEILGSNYEDVWIELEKWDLAKHYLKKNFYELNLTEINKGNIVDNEKLKRERFKIYIKGQRKKIVRKRDDKPFQNYIQRVLSKFSSRISEKFQKLIEGYIQYTLKVNNKVELRDIEFLITPLWREEDYIIEKLCDAYNNNLNYYGNKSGHYIHGILKNIKADKKVKIGFKQKNLDEFKKEKEENDRKLAVRIAIGDIKESIPYKSFLKLGDFESLIKLHKLGAKILKENNSEQKIYTGYEWLK